MLKREYAENKKGDTIVDIHIKIILFLDLSRSQPQNCHYNVNNNGAFW